VIQNKNMKTILVFVSTLDGKVTKWGDPYVRAWSSEDDQKYFDRICAESGLIVMGSNTYNADPMKPSPAYQLVIMTRSPSEYTANEIAGQIYFTNEPPAGLVARFEEEGYDQMLIVGGAQIATSFLKKQLIDELWLTIEPEIFGLGGNFVLAEKLDINLTLISCEQVNKQGTLITKYAVIKDKETKFQAL
jgi:dihydrofolate reductase